MSINANAVRRKKGSEDAYVRVNQQAIVHCFEETIDLVEETIHIW